MPNEKAKSAAFGTFRKTATNIAAVVAVVFGLIHFAVTAADLLKYKGGIPSAKVLIAGTQGALSGLAVWATVAMFTLTFAPQRWLLKSRSGRFWMASTGLRDQSNTVALRIITAIIGTVAGGWLILAVVILFELLTSDK